MKKFTNHSPGLRGINTTDGMIWLDPGQSETIDPKTVIGDVPDLGTKPAGSASDEGADALAAETKRADTAEAALKTANGSIDDLKKKADALAAETKKSVADLEKQIAEQAKQIDELTKPKT